MWSKTDNKYILNAVSRHEFPTTHNLFFVYTFSYISFFSFRHSSCESKTQSRTVTFHSFDSLCDRSSLILWCVRARVRACVRRVRYCTYRAYVSACACVCVRVPRIVSDTHKIDRTRYFCASDHIVQIYYAIRVKYKYIRNSAHFCDSYGIIMGFQEKEYAFVCIRKSQGMYRHEATWSNATD